MPGGGDRGHGAVPRACPRCARRPRRTGQDLPVEGLDPVNGREAFVPPGEMTGEGQGGVAMPSAEGTHRARIPLVSVVSFLATAFIAGCAAAPAKVTVGGETRLSAPLHEPIAPYPTGEPELAFCVEVEEAGRAPGEALAFFRRHAPFRQIAPVDSDSVACDVRLNLHWEFATGGGTVVARSADDGAVLMSAEAEGVWGPTFGVERLGPIVYNAFVPGSPLYRKLTHARKAEEAAWQEAVRHYRETPVKPALPEEARRFKVQAEAALAQK